MITVRQHNDNPDWVVLELKEDAIHQSADVIVSKTSDVESAIATLRYDNRLYRGIETPLQENEYEACPYCGDEVTHYAPDGISACRDHGIVEGSTIISSVNL